LLHDVEAPGFLIAQVEGKMPKNDPVDFCDVAALLIDRNQEYRV